MLLRMRTLFIIVIYGKKTNAPSGVWSELLTTGCWSAVDLTKESIFKKTDDHASLRKTRNRLFLWFFFFLTRWSTCTWTEGRTSDWFLGPLEVDLLWTFGGKCDAKDGTVLNALLCCIMWRWCSSMLGGSQGESRWEEDVLVWNAVWSP